MFFAKKSMSRKHFMMIHLCARPRQRARLILAAPVIFTQAGARQINSGKLAWVNITGVIAVPSIIIISGPVFGHFKHLKLSGFSRTFKHLMKELYAHLM